MGMEALPIVNDTDRIREETYRLWVAEGRPDVPRSAFIERAVRILAERRQLRDPARTDDPRPALKPPRHGG